MYQNNFGAKPYNQYGVFSPEGAKLFAEKKAIRKAAMQVSIPMLILTAFMQFWTIPYLFVMGFLGYSSQQAIAVMSDPAIMQVVQIVISSFAFIVPFAITVSITNNKISSIIPFGAPQKQLWLPFFLIGVGFCAFSNVATSVSGGIFESFGFEYNLPSMDDPKGIFGFFLCVLATAVTPALVEEFACRGVIHGYLSRFGEGFAIIVTSVIFGVMHGNFTQMFFAFLVGLVLSYVRVKTGSIWICILIHFTNNFISVVLSWMSSSVPGILQTGIYLIYLCVCMVLGIVGMQMLKKFNGNFLNFKSPKSQCSEQQKYKWFFTSVPVIIFLVVYAFQSLSFLSF